MLIRVRERQAPSSSCPVYIRNYDSCLIKGQLGSASFCSYTYIILTYAFLLLQVNTSTALAQYTYNKIRSKVPWRFPDFTPTRCLPDFLVNFG